MRKKYSPWRNIYGEFNQNKKNKFCFKNHFYCFNNFPDSFKEKWGIVNGIKLSLSVRLLALRVNIILIVINEALVVVIIKLFSLYESGKIFTRNNVNCYKLLGLLILLHPFARIITKALEVLALSINNLHHGFIFHLAGENIIDIIIGCIILLIAWIMDEGRKMDEEQQYKV